MRFRCHLPNISCRQALWQMHVRPDGFQVTGSILPLGWVTCMGSLGPVAAAVILKESACAPQLLCVKPSLSGLDRLTLSLFFVWGIVSVLFGGIVGGSILTALSPEFINQPSERACLPLCLSAATDEQSGGQSTSAG